MKWKLGLVAAAGLVAAVVAAVADSGGPWKQLPDPPLSPRAAPTGFWTGEEVVLVGGDTEPCHPAAACAAPESPPLADGAAYNVRTNTWRSIAEPPFGFAWAVPFVFGATAYLWVPGESYRPEAPSGFLAYRIDDDSWDELSLPTDGDPNAYMFLTLEDRIVAYNWGDETRELPDYVFDVGSEAWSELPDDPLSPGYDRVMRWTGEELVLFDHELGDIDDDARLRGAAFDFETERWRVLDDPDAAWRRTDAPPSELARPSFEPFGSSDWEGTWLAAGASRFVFVGVVWDDQSSGDLGGTLHSAAWLSQ
jgi:hypothetical protein